jgi:hypothetical protein
MELVHQMTVSTLSVLTAVVIALVADQSWPGGIAPAWFGVLPPFGLAILLLWNGPAQWSEERAW